ncbi:AAA family ATPase [Coniochaeta ligniaria NRRL 30616]|uniref:AAA family ATPase n=1 Tax=Coniochaeta ligniaria NRRL 30616 TaxID=1408157 RepID=A0A1J7JQU4_9PEZI|nr:AAA family ATPase [Coniochaeta ligniaria NRRL 30616]
MARTVQRARGTGEEVPDEEDQQEMTARLTEEDKRKRAELEKAPMQAELKHLEKRWTKKGRGYITEPKEDEDVPEQTTNWYEKFALCVTRQYDSTNRYVNRTTLQINSQPLKEILADVIGSYPGQSFYTSSISIDFPAHCLYHYRSELKAALANQEPGSEGAAHLPILLSFIEEHHADAIKEGDNLREQGLVSYDHLWTIFRPGTLVYGSRSGQACVFQLTNYAYQCGQCPGLQLSLEYTDYDGNDFGKRYNSIMIPMFSGAQPIAALNALPLSMHPDPEGVRTILIERGRRWEALAGQNFREYKGVAMGERGSLYNIDGRVMIDCKTFHRIEPNLSFNVSNFPVAPGGSKRKQHSEWDLVTDDTPEIQLDPLTDDQVLLASPLVRGYSFTEKKFLDFFVDKTSPIEWNTACFEQLVLPSQQKELVQALVSEHTQRVTSGGGNSASHFDDIVKGKGRGLILVLHGPPGVGKTLTAECVAEFSQRPLYIVSSGDLGTNSSTLDERLSRTLDLASTWKAVLLIDEADVFLERRSLHDMERNSLVSIFLRTLEYYSGILFMTTNRVATFDDAFKSRIHVPLKYGQLPASSRVKVWKNFLAKLEVEGGIDIDEEGYRKLAEGKLNGRQIKNVVRTAKSLASYKKRKLDQEQLQQVMDIQMAFEEELDGVGDGDIDMVER